MSNGKEISWTNISIQLNGQEVITEPLDYPAPAEPFLVIFKVKPNYYTGHTCITIDEALALAGRKDLGEFACSYNLATNSVMHLEDHANKELKAVIDRFKEYGGYPKYRVDFDNACSNLSNAVRATLKNAFKK